MNTLTAPQRPELRHSAAAPLRQLPIDGRLARTSLPDRIALRIALALLLWSTRPTRRASATTQRAARERELRERAWQQRYYRLPLL